MATRPLKPKVGRPKGKLTQHKRLDRLKSALERTPAGVTLKDLARLGNVTERSVRRYLLEVKDAWDLESVRTAPSGAALWRIKPSERGRSVQLRRAQALALLGAASALDDLAASTITEDARTAKDQLRQLVEKPVKRGAKETKYEHAPLRFVVYRPTDRTSKIAREVIDEVFAAVSLGTEVSLRMKEVKGESHRFLPWSLWAHAEQIYLIGRWEHAEETELIDLSQVVVARAQHGTQVKAPSEEELSAFGHGVMGVRAPARYEIAVLEIDAESTPAYRGVRVHPAQTVLRSKDGRMRITVPMVDTDKLLRWVLAQAGAVHVVAPVALVDLVKGALARSAAKYE